MFDKRDYIRVFVVVIISTFLALNIRIFLENYYQRTFDKSHYNLDSNLYRFDDLDTQGIVQDHYAIEYLNNSNFNSQSSWFSIEEGDSTDVNGIINSGQANLDILGEQHTFSLIADPPLALDWIETNNPELPDPPDIAEITSQGCRVSHQFDDVTAVQQPSVHWDHNVSMPIDMSDYVIKSASVQAIINATVDENLDRLEDYLTGDLARLNPNYIVDTYSIGDFIQYYILVSDLEKHRVYEIAYFQTEQIGSSDPPGKDYLYDTFMLGVSQEDLIYALTSVLSIDNSNFTVTLGITLHIEDNLANYWDLDYFDEIYIKFVNLTFIFEKRIDQYTSISLNQIGNKLHGSDIDIINATLNFKYKIDRNWPNNSPNSEIWVYVNDRIHPEAVKLSSAKSTFQEIKLGGFNVKNFIIAEENISISIKIYIADTFTLNQTIRISIDNASLFISYINNVVEAKTELDLFLNSINKTQEKTIDVTIGNSVNIEIKYMDQLKKFIENASVQLKGLGSPINLTENSTLKYYHISIQTINLNLGNNYLTLSASKKYYEPIEIQININVKKINCEIRTLLGEPRIEIQTGSIPNIELSLINLETNEVIMGAIVEYSWEFGTGILEDKDNDGIYETTLKKCPSGTYTINITAFAGVNYSFEQYELNLIVHKPTGINREILNLFIIISIIAFTIIGILTALSMKNYVFAPRKIKKRNELLLRTQIFKDADNIQGILLIHTESGLPIFSKNYSAIMKGKKTLFSGFIQAVSLFSDEISNSKIGKPTSKEAQSKKSVQKVIELDFKHFFCLIFDIEELRTVLILKNRSSKRLKRQMFKFSLFTYLRISEQLKEWNHRLEQFRDIIPPLLNEYFCLYYKEFFKLAIDQPKLEEVKKKLNLTKLQFKILKEFCLIATENKIFKLMTLLEKFSEKNEDSVIDAIQVLINHELIIPYF
ncbi:MAG: hypothetical protein ACFE88_07910 [Candidatus Hermodarchaeota archaeon]